MLYMSCTISIRLSFSITVSCLVVKFVLFFLFQNVPKCPSGLCFPSKGAHRLKSAFNMYLKYHQALGRLLEQLCLFVCLSSITYCS